MWRPIRTRIGPGASAASPSLVAATAPGAVGKAMKKASPWVSTSMPPCAAKSVSQHPAVLGKGLRICLGPQLVHELRRALDVGEQEGDGSGREITGHRPMMNRSEAPVTGRADKGVSDLSLRGPQAARHPHLSESPILIASVPPLGRDRRRRLDWERPLAASPARRRSPGFSSPCGCTRPFRREIDCDRIIKSNGDHRMANRWRLTPRPTPGTKTWPLCRNAP